MIRFLILLLLSPMTVWGIGLGPTCPAVHAVAGFMPTQIRSVQLWLDANRLCLPPGTNVDTWKDFSLAAGSSFGSAIASQRPLISNINGRPSVKFDGVNDYLTVGSITLQTSISLFLVLKDGTNRFFVEHSNNSLANQGFAFSGGASPWLVNRTAVRQANGTDGWAGASPCVISFIYSVSNTNGASKRCGQTQSIPSYASQGVPAETAVSQPLYLMSQAGTTTFSDANLAELIIVTNVISAVDELNLMRHLGTKYGIVIP